MVIYHQLSAYVALTWPSRKEHLAWYLNTRLRLNKGNVWTRVVITLVGPGSWVMECIGRAYLTVSTVKCINTLRRNQSGGSTTSSPSRLFSAYSAMALANSCSTAPPLSASVGGPPAAPSCSAPAAPGSDPLAAPTPAPARKSGDPGESLFILTIPLIETNSTRI